ncbi:MAG: hypothetical protein ACKPKO_36830, partial [Candidatus Fonsibacter sp.]
TPGLSSSTTLQDKGKATRALAPTLHTVDEEAPLTHRRLREASKRHACRQRLEDMLGTQRVYDSVDDDFEERPQQALGTRTWVAWLQNAGRPASRACRWARRPLSPQPNPRVETWEEICERYGSDPNDTLEPTKEQQDWCALMAHLNYGTSLP